VANCASVSVESRASARRVVTAAYDLASGKAAVL
jgi:hypothetical protein